MKRTAMGLLLGVAGVVSLTTSIGGHGFFFWNDQPRRFPSRHHTRETSFQRVATFGTCLA